jgi:Glycosyltransferase family 87
LRRDLAGPLLLAILVRLVPILATDRVEVDIARYHRVARHLLDVSWNPYETRRLYPYPPPWAAVEAGAEWLARRGVGTFPIDVKLPVLLADLFLVAALVRAARSGRASPAAGWIYAAHPVSVLVTGFHGQFDGVVLLFVILALDALARERRDRAALLLSAAIALKSFPVLFLPFLALGGRSSWRAALRFAVLALAPVALLLLPFAIADFPALRRELLGYSGIADFGWTGLVRGVEWLTSGHLARSAARFWPVATAASKVLFLSAWGALVAAFATRRFRLSPERACLAAILAFYVFYGSLSAQYLLWAVPLGVRRPSRGFALHALAATAGLVGFYLFLAPGALLPAPLAEPAVRWAGELWVAGVAATLVVSAAWLSGLLREARSAPPLTT